MASFFREGQKFSHNGIRGTIIKITETFRKNVIVVKVEQLPPKSEFKGMKIEALGFFEYPDGKIEFMSVID